IRVVVRVRPQLPAEKTHSCETLQLGNHTVRLGVTDSSQKEFRFDHVLGPSATQKEVYDTAGVAQSIASVLEGYHATLFAYGQTGSGKTYTMEGFEYEVPSSSMLLKFTEGVKDKIMATTNMNAASSRSHCIYTIYVESIDLENPSLVTTTKLCLVDLAGSERIVKTGATGAPAALDRLLHDDNFYAGVTLQESIGINKSLFVLRQVIQVLSDEANMNPTGQNAVAKTHVPYRDSKLTSLLKHR
ncbi:hypothetical protein DYB32_002809, partial [Aphanomyces invadans]